MQSELYVDAAHTLAGTQQSLLVNLTIAYTLLVSVVIFFVFLPRIGTLNLELRQRKGLLLLLPPQVMGGLPYVRQLIKEVLVESTPEYAAQGALSSGGHRRASNASTGRRASIGHD